MATPVTASVICRFARSFRRNHLIAVRDFDRGCSAVGKYGSNEIPHEASWSVK
jgi:hypothetical protein